MRPNQFHLLIGACDGIQYADLVRFYFVFDNKFRHHPNTIVLNGMVANL